MEKRFLAGARRIARLALGRFVGFVGLVSIPYFLWVANQSPELGADLLSSLIFTLKVAAVSSLLILLGYNAKRKSRAIKNAFAGNE